MFLADEVHIQLVPALVGILLQPGGVPAEVARDVDRFLHLFRRDVLADDVERLDGLEVPAGRRGEDVAAPLVVGDCQRLFIGRRPADVNLEAGGAAAAGLAVGIEHLLQRFPRLVDGDQAVGPCRVAGCGLGCDGGTDEVWNGRGQRPESRAVDVHETFVAHLLSFEQSPDDVDAFDEALVANFLARPDFSGDPFVGCFARSERRPEPARKHLREGGDGLRDDCRVVALPGRVDDPERKVRGGQRRAEERPGEARLALSLAPRTEVVGGHAGREAGLLSLLDILE